MNGTCAGGTGAFIDQMAMLLAVEPEGINEMARRAQRTYTIASRCGVFAKSDVQPLLNQGAHPDDIAASILEAVVNQTIGGLAQGRRIEGNVLYLGGPLFFMPSLRKAFDGALALQGHCPENALYYVALGAALCATKEINHSEAMAMLQQHSDGLLTGSLPPLFNDHLAYETFKECHSRATVERASIEQNNQKAYLGIDAGSTTTKTILLNEQNQILHESYQMNVGNPVATVKNILEELYADYPTLHIAGAAVTGYGEQLLKEALQVDFSLVETVAHLMAAQFFQPDVDFVIDIGGQDIKCFKIRDHVIDNVFLNEACSSGCGSFLQTFASALNYSIEEFAATSFFAQNPVDLGSRCTVFMNSSVKQAQKEGATVGDISAGLAISVVKNALYKVIRTSSAKDLGKKIVVQGGTFLNDAVLRAFEQELGIEVTRPAISGLMGAFGAALYAKERSQGTSSLLSSKALQEFTHKVTTTKCHRCANTCLLTINTFNSGNSFISGNRCERPTGKNHGNPELNIYHYKFKRLTELATSVDEAVIDDLTIGLPLALNVYELLPFWHTFFSQLGFSVVIPPPSNREIYLLGQHSIPSDTICFPAKLMHGQVQYLINRGVKNIFYPNMTYNIDEQLSDNHYNCPIVAYYGEVLLNNIKELKQLNFIKTPLGLHRPKDVGRKLYPIVKALQPNLTIHAVQAALKAAYQAYEDYLSELRQQGTLIIEQAKREGKTTIVLAGRPYHVDPEVNHGIDRLINDFGIAIVSEDALPLPTKKLKVNVLNQWTYHARLYAAAEIVSRDPALELVQLVSFGCGLDAITSDETRAILEKHQRLYTQLKIDEIGNLGAVRIRIRSLLAAIEQQRRVG